NTHLSSSSRHSILPFQSIKMIYRILTVACLAGLVAAQNFGRPNPSFPSNGIPCGFVCTRNAAFTTWIDGVNSRASCSDRNGDVSERCNGCCQAYALSGGLTTTAASGFPSSDGNTCVCCVNNVLCQGGNNGPVPTFAINNGNGR
ncbi:hypothetical protein PFISCL1PPCAC_1394, partial [Pristionchus fissidentatus]